MQNIKNIAFDLGGVVLALSLEGAIRTFEKMGLVDARERLDAFQQRGVFADRAATIAAKKAGCSLLALENAINSVANFKNAETSKIIAAAPKVVPVKSLKLNIAHTTPLKDEADVDSYLMGLKTQLMAEISDGASVLVIGA